MLDFFLDIDDTLNYKPILIDQRPKTEDSENEGLNKIFSAIRSSLSDDLVKKTSAVFQFNITGIKFLWEKCELQS